MVARTELVATVPRRIALCHAPGFGLGTAPPPLPIRRFAVRMIWHRRLGTDSAISWLREEVTNAARRLDARAQG